MALYDGFPCLQNGFLIIRKMDGADLDALAEITDNENVYRYIPPFLFKKSRGNLLAAIRNCGGRDFDKQKRIIAGIYLQSEPCRLVGLAQMFDYRKRQNRMTIGFTVNEANWNSKIATNAIALMKSYLLGEQGVGTLYAYVMPENVYSSRALVSNGFKKQPETEQKANWAGKAEVTVDVYACGPL